MKASLLWITDPWETLHTPTETTLRLIQEAHHQQISQFWCNVKTLRFEHPHILLDAHPMLTPSELGKPQSCAPSDFNTILYRPDPPVHLNYIHPLHLLQIALQASPTRIINPISVLLQKNEKIEPLAFSKWTPPSLISTQWTRLLAFGEKEKITVTKPLHQAQSQGVALLYWRTPEEIQQSYHALHHSTQGFHTPILLQKYLPGIQDGETRLWFVQGELIAHIKKFPIKNDFRIQIDQGSRLEKAPLSKKEKILVGKLTPYLQQQHIHWAAIDLIENQITDFNFTSPGLIYEMEQVLHQNLASLLIQSLISHF